MKWASESPSMQTPFAALPTRRRPTVVLPTPAGPFRTTTRWELTSFSTMRQDYAPSRPGRPTSSSERARRATPNAGGEARPSPSAACGGGSSASAARRGRRRRPSSSSTRPRERDPADAERDRAVRRVADRRVLQPAVLEPDINGDAGRLGELVLGNTAAYAQGAELRLHLRPRIAARWHGQTLVECQRGRGVHRALRCLRRAPARSAYPEVSQGIQGHPGRRTDAAVSL